MNKECLITKMWCADCDRETMHTLIGLFLFECCECGDIVENINLSQVMLIVKKKDLKYDTRKVD